MLTNLRAYNDIIDWDVNQFDEETNETHYAESNSGGYRNLLEFLAIGFCATFYKSNRVLGENSTRFAEFYNFVHDAAVGSGLAENTKKRNV